jgi:hypothetical protein
MFESWRWVVASFHDPIKRRERSMHDWDQNYFTDRDLELKTYPDHQYI